MATENERHRHLRRVGALNCRREGLESTILGVEVVGGVGQDGQPLDILDTADYMALMQGVADELLRPVRNTKP